MAASVVFWQKYPLGVRQYKTIILGMPAAEKADDSMGWAPPYNRVFEESEFFVYSLGDEAMCISDDCGMGGYFVGCLGGWISGYKDIGEVSDYGLRSAGMDIDKQKVITIADKDARIVGIYPGRESEICHIFYANTAILCPMMSLNGVLIYCHGDGIRGMFNLPR